MRCLNPIAKFQALFGTDTCPHGDTLNVAFGRLNPDQVQAVVTALIRTLIRKKVLYRYRLAERLKAEFPRLPICLSLDSLFAGGPTMSICEENNWKFMIVHKDGDIPFVHNEFESLLPLTPENHFTFLTGLQGKTRQEYRWITNFTLKDKQVLELAHPI